MVRPIEITDALSKSSEVGRLQQAVQSRPEAAQEFQKTLSEKNHIHQVSTPNPTPQTDIVILHGDEQEKEKRKTAEDRHQESDKKERDDKDNQPHDNKIQAAKSSPADHIDIKI